MQETIACKNCGNHFLGKYCNQCGEKVYREQDKLFSRIADDAFHFITHFDGSFFTTFKTFIRQPGKLSADFCNGIRKKYFKPIPFFLMMVALYFVFPKFEGLNMKAQTLVAKQYDFTWLTHPVFKAKMKKDNISYKEVAAGYDAKSPKIAKISLLLLIPLSGIFLSLLFYSRRRLLYDHLILSSEILSFFIFSQFLVLPFIALIVEQLIPKYWFLFNDGSFIWLIMYALLAFFIGVSFRNFYKEKYWLTIIKAMVFMFVFFVAIKYIYAVIVFLLTMLFV